MTTLVTGGSGYIGSHVVRLLRNRGDDVVVLDDFVTGVAERVGGTPAIAVNLASDAAVSVVRATVEQYDVDSVIHFAARKQVAESVERPAWYYSQNVGSLANVLQGIESSAVRSFVFSSSAAVYGSAQGAQLAESSPTVPVNPYGATKLIGEQLVEWVARASDLRAVSLRYFNVAGAGWDDLGDSAVLNLVPMVFERIDQGQPPVIFGDDYETPDGTCVRDYIHVLDLAEAHLSAIDYARSTDSRSSVFNVGTGVGSSVRDVIDAVAAVTGLSVEPEVRGRRHGDPDQVVASPALINETLGWVARHGLGDIIESAWNAHVSRRPL